MTRPNPRAAHFGQPISNPAMERRYRLRHVIRLTIHVDVSRFAEAISRATEAIRRFQASTGLNTHLVVNTPRETR